MNAKLTRWMLIISLLLLTSTAHADPASPLIHDLRISQIYGGGGTSGAALKSDFVELYNHSDSAIDLSGWSLQYASAAANNWSVTPLGPVVIAPYGYLLVKMAEGSGGSDAGTALAQPDVVGSINLSSRSGKVALVEAVATISGFGDPAIRDFVGYGSANDFEGSGPAPGFSNTTGAARKSGGCIDADDNAADFDSVDPAPRNSQSPGTVCGLRLRDIQADRHLSPYAGFIARDLPGVITVVRPSGFYLQDPEPDRRVSTAEALFVRTAEVSGLFPGDALLVTGLVQETRDEFNPAELTVTTLISPTISLQSQANPLPPPVILGLNGRVPPHQVIDDDANGDVETSGIFNATVDGIDFWESLEGMLVQVENALIVGPNSSGVIAVVGDGGALASGLSPRGALVIGPDDFNPERIFVNPLFQTLPRLHVGQRFSAPISGPLDYVNGNFVIQAVGLPAALPFDLPPELAPAALSDQLSVATFNVKNLGPDDGPAAFAALAAAIVDNLDAPDLLALQEVQDNSGAADDGVVDAALTLGLLIDAIAAAGGPAYDFRQINPRNHGDGGQPGGNIRVAFLFRSDRGLTFVDRPGGDAVTPTFVVAGGFGPELTLSPGRIDPANPAFFNSRRSLAGEFRFRGRTIFVIANHFNSRIGDTPLFGRWQPPQLSSEPGRIAKAQVIHAFVAGLLDLDPAARVIVLGDFNDFHFAPALQTLAGDKLHPLSFDLPATERYSYIYEGNAQMIDHILVSDSLYAAQPEIDVVHINPEYAVADQFTDHDPVLARFILPDLTEVLFIPLMRR